MKDEFCPQCVIEYVKLNGLENLGEEANTLEGKDVTVQFKLCSEHESYNLFSSLTKAREVVRG